MDYAGKVHRFKAGLPGLLGRNNFMLSEVMRSTGEIFSFTRKFLDNDHSTAGDASTAGAATLFAVPPGGGGSPPPPRVSHTYQGEKVKVIVCEQESMQSTLLSVLSNLQEKGTRLDDTAILLGKRTESIPLERSINHELSSTDRHKVTVDTVRRFSGLERPVIIGFNPRVNEKNANFNRFMANLASRATNDVIIITTKDLSQV